jgi:hypothetical protein
MARRDRTQRVTAEEHEQEPTRRLSVYEEQERTQRLQVPPVPPWDTEEPVREPDWEVEQRQQHRSRGWPTALVVVFTLLGVLLGVLGTLVVTGATRSQVQTLEGQLAGAQQLIADRDEQIRALEQQLEDARSSPFPQLQLPPGIDLPDLPGLPVLPGNERGLELLDQIQDQIRNLINRSTGSG